MQCGFLGEFFLRFAPSLLPTVLLLIVIGKIDSSSLFSRMNQNQSGLYQALMKLRNTKTGRLVHLGSKLNPVLLIKMPLLSYRQHLANGVLFPKSAMDCFINWLLHFADGWISSKIYAAVCSWQAGV